MEKLTMSLSVNMLAGGLAVCVAIAVAPQPTQALPLTAKSLHPGRSLILARARCAANSWDGKCIAWHVCDPDGKHCKWVQTRPKD
jgi:hypothetical protein